MEIDAYDFSRDTETPRTFTVTFSNAETSLNDILIKRLVRRKSTKRPLKKEFDRGVYKLQFPRRVNLPPNYNFQLKICDISIPNSLLNITSQLRNNQFKFNGVVYDIPDGQYQSIHEVVDVINDTIRFVSSVKEVGVTFSFSRLTVSVRGGYIGNVRFSSRGVEVKPSFSTVVSNIFDIATFYFVPPAVVDSYTITNTSRGVNSDVEILPHALPNNRVTERRIITCSTAAFSIKDALNQFVVEPYDDYDISIILGNPGTYKFVIFMGSNSLQLSSSRKAVNWSGEQVGYHELLPAEYPDISFRAPLMVAGGGGGGNQPNVRTTNTIGGGGSGGKFINVSAQFSSQSLVTFDIGDGGKPGFGGMRTEVRVDGNVYVAAGGTTGLVEVTTPAPRRGGYDIEELPYAVGSDGANGGTIGPKIVAGIEHDAKDVVGSFGGGGNGSNGFIEALPGGNGLICFTLPPAHTFRLSPLYAAHTEHLHFVRLNTSIGTLAKYVAIHQDKNSHHQMVVGDIQVFANNDTVNVASGKRLIVSTNHDYAAKIVIIDGNPSTYWSSGGDGADHWILIDLEDYYWIDSIVVYGNGVNNELSNDLLVFAASADIGGSIDDIMSDPMITYFGTTSGLSSSVNQQTLVNPKPYDETRSMVVIINEGGGSLQITRMNRKVFLTYNPSDRIVVFDSLRDTRLYDAAITGFYVEINIPCIDYPTSVSLSGVLNGSTDTISLSEVSFITDDTVSVGAVHSPIAFQGTDFEPKLVNSLSNDIIGSVCIRTSDSPTFTLRAASLGAYTHVVSRPTDYKFFSLFDDSRFISCTKLPHLAPLTELRTTNVPLKIISNLGGFLTYLSEGEFEIPTGDFSFDHLLDESNQVQEVNGVQLKGKMGITNSDSYISSLASILGLGVSDSFSNYAGGIKMYRDTDDQSAYHMCVLMMSGLPLRTALQPDLLGPNAQVVLTIDEITDISENSVFPAIISLDNSKTSDSTSAGDTWVSMGNSTAFNSLTFRLYNRRHKPVQLARGTPALTFQLRALERHHLSLIV